MRSQILEGTTTKVKTACGNLYCTLNHDDNKEPQECFIILGKAGGCTYALMQAISGLIRVALKYKVPLEEIVSKLEGISCYRIIPNIPSCIEGIAQCLKGETSGPNGTKVDTENRTCLADRRV